MINKCIAFTCFALLFLSCKESNFIITKDEAGQMTEKYTVNENGERDGVYEGYVDGVLTESAHYKDGKLHGKRTLFYPDGQVEILENYKEDLIVGTYTTYYPDGTTSQQATYISGMMQGMLKTYYKSGQLKEEVIMVDNQENGPFKEFHENGNLKWEGQFLNGDNEYGILKNYNEQGELIKKMECNEQGVCATIWTLEKGDITADKKDK